MGCFYATEHEDYYVTDAGAVFLISSPDVDSGELPLERASLPEGAEEITGAALGLETYCESAEECERRGSAIL